MIEIKCKLFTQDNIMKRIDSFQTIDEGNVSNVMPWVENTSKGLEEKGTVIDMYTGDRIFCTEAYYEIKQRLKEAGRSIIE